MGRLWNSRARRGIGGKGDQSSATLPQRLCIPKSMTSTLLQDVSPAPPLMISPLEIPLPEPVDFSKQAVEVPGTRRPGQTGSSAQHPAHVENSSRADFAEARKTALVVFSFWYDVSASST